MNALAVAPDSSWLAASNGPLVQTWDTTTGQVRATLTGHGGPVYAIAVAQDGSRIATTSDDRTVRVWDAATGHVQALLRVEEAIFACAWLGVRGLAVGGPAGLGMLDFLDGTTTSESVHEQTAPT